MSLILVLSG